MSVDQARDLILSFPEAFESSHRGHPDFRNPGGIFATLRPDQGRSVLRLPTALAESLEAREPGTFKVVSRSGGMGWTSVQLADADAEEFHALVSAAWDARYKPA